MAKRGELLARSVPVRLTRMGLALILAGYLALATLQSFATRLQWGPDEPAHIVYVRSLAEDRRLPELCDTAEECRYAPGESRSYQAQHPPLHYALAALIWRASAGRPSDHVSYRDRRSGESRRFSVPGGARPVRLMSVLLGAATLAALWGAAQTVFPGRPVLWLSSVALTGFTPMFTYMGGVISNDALLSVVFVVTGWCWARLLRFGVGRREVLTLGILLGIGLNVKETALGLVPASLVALALAPGKARWGRRIAWMVGTVTLAAALGGWWFVRKALIYGSLFVYAFHFPLLGLPEQQRLALMYAMPGRIFLFAFVPIDAIIAHANMTFVTSFFAALVMLSAAGLALVLLRRGKIGLPRHEALSLALWLGTGAVVLAGLVHNLLFVDWRMGTSGGRLLVCLLPLAAMALARGLDSLLGEGRLAKVGLLVICLLLLADAVILWDHERVLTRSRARSRRRLARGPARATAAEVARLRAELVESLDDLHTCGSDRLAFSILATDYICRCGEVYLRLRNVWLPSRRNLLRELDQVAPEFARLCRKSLSRLWDGKAIERPVRRLAEIALEPAGGLAEEYEIRWD